ncbi:hypothetical protein ACXYX3_02510 [Mycobacterium sp. C3-094]
MLSYSAHRRALRVASMSVAAETLRAPAVAEWARRSGVGVHAHSAAGLDGALSAGIEPMHITLHCSDDPALMQREIYPAIGQFVLTSKTQCDMLSDTATVTHRVLLDVTASTDPHFGRHVAMSPRLEIIGAHCTLDRGAWSANTVASVIATLSCLRHHHGTIAGRLSVDGLAPTHDVAPRQLRDAAVGLESCVEDACARFRYPRPALVVRC